MDITPEELAAAEELLAKLRGDNEWHDVKRPRTLPLGIRVRAYRNPSGREYLRFDGKISKEQRAQYTGVLIRSEWKQNIVKNVRYTVLCDDGQIRRFQVIERI